MHASRSSRAMPVWARNALIGSAVVLVIVAVIALTDGRHHVGIAGALAVLGLVIVSATTYGLVRSNRGTVGDRDTDYVDGLPNAQFIHWLDRDGEWQVATNNGDGTWRHDGETVSSSELLTLAGDADVTRL